MPLHEVTAFPSSGGVQDASVRSMTVAMGKRADVVGAAPGGGASSGSGSGTVTSVSLTTTGGIAGSVTNPTTTPAVTITGIDCGRWS